MRDAMGGTVTLVIIVVFIVIALGYMAFNVNYTKAFRMKNKIISVDEDYNGNCNSNCEAAIKNYAKSIGYSLGNDLECAAWDANFQASSSKLYCYQEVTCKDCVTQENGSSVIADQHYYRIVTKINVEIPIINNSIGLKMFYITGDTKTFNKD